MTQDVLAEALRATYDDGDGLGYRLVLMDESGGVIPTPLPDTFIEAIRAALVRTPETLDQSPLREALEEAITLPLVGGFQLAQANWRKAATEYDRLVASPAPDPGADQ